MLHWNVYCENVNARRMEIYDIFSRSSFRNDVKKCVKKCGNDKEQFAESLRKALMHRFWAKCEWEIVLSPFHEDSIGTFEELKIDVYDQVSLNWNAFVDYAWAHKKRAIGITKHQWRTYHDRGQKKTILTDSLLPRTGGHVVLYIRHHIHEIRRRA